MYTIEVEYTTGDSFNSYRETDNIGYCWENLDKAKLALQWMKQHYAAYQEVNDSWKGSKKEKDFSKEPWFCHDDKGAYWSYSIVLEDDNGDPAKISTSMWIGYFETLHSAKIIHEEVVDTDMSFTI